VGQLVLQAGEARHIRRFDAQQLDQVVTELGTHRGGNLILVQLVQRVLEGRVVDARTGKAEVTAGVGRARVLRELLGQRGEILTLGQALLDFFDRALAWASLALSLTSMRMCAAWRCSARLAISFRTTPEFVVVDLTWSKKADFFSSM
jgi:hypothetical protein